ncbi:MAG: hypothetical protein EOM14_06100, partial [Clostridia bacterium]|nr:hypothetical protein [Clostridia bacterium]
MDLIIKNGTLVDSGGFTCADLAVKDGKIAAIGKDLSFPGAEFVEAAGKLVLPGAIDVHTHLAMPFGGTVSADDYFALAIIIEVIRGDAQGFLGEFDLPRHGTVTLDAPDQ